MISLGEGTELKIEKPISGKAWKYEKARDGGELQVPENVGL